MSSPSMENYGQKTTLREEKSSNTKENVAQAVYNYFEGEDFSLPTFRLSQESISSDEEKKPRATTTNEKNEEKEKEKEKKRKRKKT